MVARKLQVCGKSCTCDAARASACRLGMPNVDWSPVDISSMSMFSVVDFNTTGAVRLHVWYFQALSEFFIACFR